MADRPSVDEPVSHIPDYRIEAFRRRNGLAADEESKTVWMAKLGSFEMPLPNWRWRREIVALHDGHHIRTGYDTSVKGELLVASWELGAAVYSDWRARLLCRALMLIGLARFPSDILVAYRKGKASR